MAANEQLKNVIFSWDQWQKLVMQTNLPEMRDIALFLDWIIVHQFDETSA